MSGFSTVKLLLSPPPFPCSSPWKKVTTCSLHLKSYPSTPFKMKYLHKLFGILHGRFMSSPPFKNYSIMHLYWYGLGYYFVFLAVTQNFFIYFVQKFPALAFGSFVAWLLCPSDIFPQCGWFFAHLLVSSATRCMDASNSSCIYPDPAQESAFSPRSPDSFYWKKDLETKVLDAKCACCYWDITFFFLMPSLLPKHRNTCTFTNLCVCVYLSLSYAKHEFTLMSLTLVHSHRYCLSLILLLIFKFPLQQ